MKTKFTKLFAILFALAGFQTVKTKEIENFPFDPYVILKTWNYDFLVKTMGTGEEILATNKNQSYIAGLSYPAELFEISGKLEFTFKKDSISRFQFRFKHGTRVTSSDLAGRKLKDPAASPEYKHAIQKLDSMQRIDSLSRDSIISSISEVLGSPFFSGPASTAEKNARHSAVWINRGYSCQYKDYSDYSEIVFTISNVPQIVIGEFGIHPGTEILQKTSASTKKMSWATSLLGFSPNNSLMVYSDISLFLEFTSGQRYLVNVPTKSASFVPSIHFEDCDGDAIPEAWVEVPSDKKKSHTKHALFSLQFREPNLILDSDDLIPSSINILNDSQIEVTFQDGSTRKVDFQNKGNQPIQLVQPSLLEFKYLHSTKLNTDGSTNFIGGIEISFSPASPPTQILEITYKHSIDGWNPDEIRMVSIEKQP